VIVALPFATEVTSPADDTVATDELDVAHVTVGLAIVLSFAPFTVGTKLIDEPHMNEKASSVEFSLYDPDGYALTVSQWKG
jgi:hypothetical protein